MHEHVHTLSVPCSDTYVPFCPILSRCIGFQMVSFFWRVTDTSFSSLCGCSRVQIIQFRWEPGRSKANKLHAYHETIWAHILGQVLPSPKGVCGNLSMWLCDGQKAGFPNLAFLAAPKGEWAVSYSTTSGAAPTSPPEGVFRRIRR